MNLKETLLASQINNRENIWLEVTQLKVSRQDISCSRSSRYTVINNVTVSSRLGLENVGKLLLADLVLVVFLVGTEFWDVDQEDQVVFCLHLPNVRMVYTSSLFTGRFSK